jgi:hypothetical protein
VGVRPTPTADRAVLAVKGWLIDVDGPDPTHHDA